ncbi:MAG: putative NADPH-quinone reductase [Planctomycetota bacterium]|jgi:putative NADPH-quinone reductase
MKPGLTSKFLVVFGHGREEGLGCALRDFVSEQLTAATADFRMHDLLQDGFDPVLRLKAGQKIALPPEHYEDALAHQYCQDVLWADVLVFIHPVWWFGMPAIMKGWLDRILVEGIAITQDAGGSPVGLLKQKKVILIQTFGTNKVIEQTLFASMARKYWKRAVILPTGAQPFLPFSLHSADDVTPKRFVQFCDEIKGALLGR